MKQFTQDQEHLKDWIIFFEMAKLQRQEFNTALNDAGYVVEHEITTTV